MKKKLFLAVSMLLFGIFLAQTGASTTLEAKEIPPDPWTVSPSA